MKAKLWCQLMTLAMLMALASGAAHAVPDFAQVQQSFRPSDASLYDRHGEPIQQLRLNHQERRLSWMTLEDISPALRNALIISEDRRFYQHSGVDWRAVAASAWGNLWNTRTRGASTITMQLAGLIYEDLRRSSSARTAAQKVSQIVVAQSLERSWRKDQILEAYLNLVSFRGELVGVHALSRLMFGKHPSGLNQSEAAIAVALIRAPNARAAKIADRACAMLREMQVPDECNGLQGRTELALARATAGGDGNGTAASPQLAPHLARKILKAAGRPVYSTLDASTQRFAADALRRQLSALVDRNIEDGAVIVIDNASGDVLAWVGSSGTLSAAEQVDGVQALRQAGSTLKPFLYELAIERKWLTAASLLDDSPINLPTSAGVYIPQNYDRQFKGLVSLRTALGSSLNIPAVRTLVMVTPETFFQRLQTLGLNLRESGDYYGYSLALGSADVSLLALTNAYRALANQGRVSAVRTVLTDPPVVFRQAMDRGAAYIIGHILSDRSARARTFGLENALSTRIWTAAKTGTSKDMRDNWCVGFSARYTVGVWVGNASGAPMWNVSGVTGAAPVWQEVMQYLHRHTGSQEPPMPASVTAQPVQFERQLEAARTEYFLPDTSQRTLRIATSKGITPSIAYPTSGMLIALDPDIPPKHQRVRFIAQGVRQGRWLLDGKQLPGHLGTQPGESGYDWLPWPGKHKLVLQSRDGTDLDQIRFEVRGALERPTGKGQAKGRLTDAGR